jgi:hypothetical protein
MAVNFASKRVSNTCVPGLLCRYFAYDFSRAFLETVLAGQEAEGLALEIGEAFGQEFRCLLCRYFCLDFCWGFCQTVLLRVRLRFLLSTSVKELTLNSSVVLFSDMFTEHIHRNPQEILMTARKKIAPALDKALLQPDVNADGYDRTNPDSITSQVAALGVGECWSRCTPLDPAMRLADLPDHLPEVRMRLRNNTMPAVRQAMKRTGATYTMEVTDIRTLGGLTYVIAIISRIA